MDSVSHPTPCFYLVDNEEGNGFKQEAQYWRAKKAHQCLDFGHNGFEKNFMGISVTGQNEKEYRCLGFGYNGFENMMGNAVTGQNEKEYECLGFGYNGFENFKGNAVTGQNEQEKEKEKRNGDFLFAS